MGAHRNNEIHGQHRTGRGDRSGGADRRSAVDRRSGTDRRTADRSAAGAAVTETGAKPAGHVVHDSRGNSVWRWDDEHSESTSILLKRLDNDQLRLEPTRPVPILGKKRQPDGTAGKSGRKPDDALALDEHSTVGGFDPYDRS